MPTSTYPHSGGRGFGSLLLPPLLSLPSLRLGGKSFGGNLNRKSHDSALLGRGPERNRHSKHRNHLEPPLLLRLLPLFLLLLVLLERGVEEVFHCAGVRCVSRKVSQQRCREERPRNTHETDRDHSLRRGILQDSQPRPQPVFCLYKAQSRSAHTFGTEWWWASASAHATDMCSCPHHERSRRCLLRHAEEPPSQPTSIICQCPRKRQHKKGHA